jgi:colicin import membrane protein
MWVSWFGLVGVFLSIVIHIGLVFFMFTQHSWDSKMDHSLPVIEVKLSTLPQQSRPAHSKLRPANNAKPVRAQTKAQTIKPSQPLVAEPPADFNGLGKLLDKLKGGLSNISRSQVALEDTASAGDEDARIARHISYLVAEVASRWKRPPNTRPDMEVLLSAHLSRSGRILSANVLRSSGDLEFDHSALEALRQVAQFEYVSRIPAALYDSHFKWLRLRFRPEDIEK